MSSHPPAAVMPDTVLVDRLVEAERRCYADWVGALVDQPGNPYRAEVRSFGNATAVVCGAIPAEILNRVFGLRLEDAGLIGEIDRFYDDHGATPVIDIAPTTVVPFYEGPNVLEPLARAGFYQAAFAHHLYRPLTALDSPDAGGVEDEGDVTIRVAGPDDADAVGSIYRTVWGDPGPAIAWLGRPEFTCYIAAVAGRDAALGVLHITEGVALMANALTDPDLRGHGCHTALLRRRLRDAAAAGCDLAAGQCRPGSVSQANQLRAGFSIATTKVWWRRLDG